MRYVLGPTLGVVYTYTVPTPPPAPAPLPGTQAPVLTDPIVAVTGIDPGKGVANLRVVRYDAASMNPLQEVRIYFLKFVDGVPPVPLDSAEAFVASALPFVIEDMTGLPASAPGGVGFAVALPVPPVVEAGESYHGQVVLGLKQ